MNATATKTEIKPCTCSLVVAFTEDGKELTTGCRATTKRTFAPGHDARLKGFLIRNGAEGNLVRVGQDVNTSAQAVADQFGFGYMVAEGIEAAKARQMAKLLKDVTKSAKKSHKTPAKVTCKVGRWTYEGVVTDSPMHGPQFTYTTAKGVQTTTTKFTRV
jgi:hypothetical protein